MAGSQEFPASPYGSGGGGGTPATTVVTETSYGQASAVGTSTDFARADHTHGTPPSPTAAAGWTDGGTTVYTTTATDQVAIGSSTATASRLLTLEGSASLFGTRAWSNATTDNVLDTYSRNGAGPDDTSARFAINGAGDLTWTDGAGSSTVRIRRSGTNTVTYDNGASGSAVWQFLGTLITQRVQVQVTSTTTTPYNVAATDYIIAVDSSGGAKSVVLQSASVQAYRVVIIKKTASANTITVTATAGNVEGGASYTLSAGALGSVTFFSDGTNWWVI